MPGMNVLISACRVSGGQLFGYSFSHRCASVVRMSECSFSCSFLGGSDYFFQSVFVGSLSFWCKGSSRILFIFSGWMRSLACLLPSSDCSLQWQQYRRMVPNHSWSASRMSALPHPLQHFLRENNGWRTWRPRRNSTYWRQENYKLTFCRRHWWTSWTSTELVKLVNRFEQPSTAYGIQNSAEKTESMTNNTNGISTDITIDNKKLEIVRSLIYLWAIVLDEWSKPEVLSWIAQTTAAVTKLGVILERQEHRLQLQDQTDAFPGHVRICVCMWSVDHNIRHWKEDTDIGD